MEFKDVITIFNQRFLDVGYQKKKHIWYKKNGEIFIVWGIDRSNYSKSFSLDCGIYIEQLDVFYNREKQFSYQFSWCHLRNDIVHMITDKDEKHNYIYDLERFESEDRTLIKNNIEQIWNLIKKYKIFEQLEEVSTYQGIADYIKANKMRDPSKFMVAHYLFKDVVEFCERKTIEKNPSGLAR